MATLKSGRSLRTGHPIFSPNRKILLDWIGVTLYCKTSSKYPISCGSVAIVFPLEDNRTVTTQWYIEVCLPQVFEQFGEYRHRSGIHVFFFHRLESMDFLNNSGV